MKALKIKKASKTAFVMETIYKKENIQRHFNLIMGLYLKVM